MPDLTRQVREFYRLGQQLLAAAPAEDEGYHPGVIATYVKSGMSRAKLYKARVFAQRFTPQDLERLCARQLPDGRRLGIGHVCELLQVADSQQRRELEQRAAEEGWSSRRLRTARLLAVGGRVTRSKAGRRPHLPSNPAALLQQIRERTDQWLRWSASVLDATQVADQTSSLGSTKPSKAESSNAKSSKAKSSKAAHDLQPPRRHLPGPVRVQLQSACQTMELLRSALDRYASRRQRAVAEVEPT